VLFADRRFRHREAQPKRSSRRVIGNLSTGRALEAALVVQTLAFSIARPMNDGERRRQ
jgi:hypothetical protein